MGFSSWRKDWTRTLRGMKGLCEVPHEELSIRDKARVEKVEEIEEKLGMRLPEEFRQVLLQFAGEVNLSWSLKEEVDLPEELSEIFGGELYWSIEGVYDSEESRRDWVRECFSNSEDEYDKVWHNKLGFLSVANGDVIAFDLENYPEKTPVVYLSHDDGEGHGYILGEDFTDFIDNLTYLGCVGLEEWQLSPFFHKGEKRLDISCENADKWRKFIGLE